MKYVVTRFFMNRSTWEAIKANPNVTRASTIGPWPEALSFDYIPVEIDDTLEDGFIETATREL